MDGGPAVGVLGDGCRSRWLCGATRTGTAVVSGLGPLVDGPHALALVAGSAGGSATAQIPFTVDQDPPLPARLSLAANPFALAGASWQRQATLWVDVAYPDAQVDSTTFEFYDAAGLRWSTQTRGTRVPITLSPSLGQPGAWRAVVRQCSASGCSAGELPFSWDTLPPPPARSEPDAPWLGAAAGRAGAQLAWPALTTPLGPVSGARHGFVGVGRSPEEAAAAARSAAAGWAPPGGGPAAGTFGTTVAALPAALVHGAARACVAVVPVSGAGVLPAAGSPVGSRCAPVDEAAPSASAGAPSGWRSGEVAVAVAAHDEGGSGLASSAVTLDGAAVTPVAGAVVVRGEGRHAVEVSARDGAGNAADPARAAVAIDATAPAIAGPARVSFVERRIEVPLSDALAGVADATLSLDGRPLETAVEAQDAERRAVVARARVPAGLQLDGAAVTVSARDLAAPAEPPLRPRRDAALAPRRARRGRRAAAVRAAAAAGGRLRPPQRAARRCVGRCDRRRAGRAPPCAAGRTRDAARHRRVSDRSGRFVREVHPRRSGAAFVRHDGSEAARPAAPMRTAPLAVTARITGASVRPHGARLAVHGRYAGRGEVARAHLHVRSGRRWVDACLDGGRPPLRLGGRWPHHRLLPDPADRAGPALALSHQARGPDDDVAVARRSQRSGSGVPSPSLGGGGPGMPAQSA